MFIGSCTNSRITDLRAGAEIVKGRDKADHVTAWAGPASERIKKQANSKGSTRRSSTRASNARAGLLDAPGVDGERAAGQAQRLDLQPHFVGRQGPGARTRLASPATAAAAAIKGAIADVSKI